MSNKHSPRLRLQFGPISETDREKKVSEGAKQMFSFPKAYLIYRVIKDNLEIIKKILTTSNNMETDRK